MTRVSAPVRVEGDWELPTAADTEALGVRLARLLGPGDLVVLAGPLGAGKTVFVRGLAAGLGVTGPVTSPTFVIARLHRAAPGGSGVALVHVDAYRLGGIAELDELDLDTDLDDAVIAVEWGEGVAERLAPAHWLVRLERRVDEVRVAQVRRVRPVPADTASGIADTASGTANTAAGTANTAGQVTDSAAGTARRVGCS